MDCYKKKLGRRVSHRALSKCQSSRVTRREDESDVIFCFSFSTRHANHRAYFSNNP